eukprot:732696-Pleurochrysis_carterae.AAC.2
MESVIKVESGHASLRREDISEFDKRRIIGVLYRQPCPDIVEPRAQVQLRRVPGRLGNEIGIGRSERAARRRGRGDDWASAGRGATGRSARARVPRRPCAATFGGNQNK